MFLQEGDKRDFVKKMKKKRRVKLFENLLRALRHYCMNTTLHGLRYIADPKLHTIERLFWLVLFAASSLTACNVIYSLAWKFQDAPTSITIESLNYQISDLPFPSVTLCPRYRVDWDKVLHVEKQIFPHSTGNETIRTFRDMLTKLSMIDFGDFDEFAFLKHRDLHQLAKINVSDLMRQVVPSCDKFLSNCWWRNSSRDCCNIFELQRTEYGFCYSFNSEVSDGRKDGNESRPRKASAYGNWSGVKVTIHLGNITKPPDSEYLISNDQPRPILSDNSLNFAVKLDGIFIILKGPWVWPNSGTIVPVGATVDAAMDCVSSSATEKVLELDDNRIPCKHESTRVYNQETCLSLCKRAHVVKYCDCNPFFLLPMSEHRDCNFEDFLCLYKYNDFFNDYRITMDKSVHDSATTMICDCPSECEYFNYYTLFTNAPLENENDIVLDVHFAAQSSLRYKTDIMFSKLDLLDFVVNREYNGILQNVLWCTVAKVSFGGIVGLFLGGSLLSAAELVYYLMVATFYYVRSCWQPKGRKFKAKRRVRTASKILPILDYGPVKPRSKKIPIFVNYSTVRSSVNRY